MKRFLTSILIAASAAAWADNGPENVILGATMKAIAQDVSLVASPANNPDPASVKDAAILTAIVRVRTASSQFDLIDERKGSVDANDKIVVGEMTPATMLGISVDKFKDMLVQFDGFLTQAKAALGDCEPLLQAQYVLPASHRNFSALKAKLADLTAIEKQAHAIFNPPTPHP
jgi:hypothetical protein